MSAKLSQQVWEHVPYAGEKMLAMLALAEWSNDEGFCVVSPEALADRVRITGDCALTLLGEFIAEGDLSLVLAGRRHGIPDVYQLRTDNWFSDKSQPLKMNASREWLEKRADLEDQAIINIGKTNEK